MLKERWHLRCQSLRRWIQTHNGSQPGADDKLPCGFGIGKWLCFQRKKLRSQRLEGEQIGALDDAAPGWRSTIALRPESLLKCPNAIELKRENLFTANLREAAALVAKVGRLPRWNGKHPDNDRLASWVTVQRRNEPLGMLSIERVQRLDNTLPGRRNVETSHGLEQRWQASLERFVARAEELGRLPTGTEPSALWMYQQRKYLKQGKLHEGREGALNEAVPGWKLTSSKRESEQMVDQCESTGLTAESKQAVI